MIVLRRRVYLLSLFVGLAIGLPALAGAATYYVAVDGADEPTRDGLSPGEAWASLAYACARVPAGDNVILVGPGRFIADSTATVKSGLTIEGAGADQTTIVAAAGWVLSGVPDAGNPNVGNTSTPGDYLISAASYELGDAVITPVTIRGMRLESPADDLIYGGIYLRDVHDVTLEDLEFENFAWAGIQVVASRRTLIQRCTFRNAAQLYAANQYSGSLRTFRLTDGEIADCVFVTDLPTPRDDGNTFLPYDYKGFFHRDVRIHGCDFRGPVGWNFDIEVPFSEDYGLEIFDNEFDGVVSLPQGGSQTDPREKYPDLGVDYSVWLHDNRFTNSYAIEGPRDFLRVTDNFFDVADDQLGGRIYTQFGGTVSTRPKWFGGNVVDGADRSFIYKEAGRLDSVYVYHNTVYYRDAAERSEAMLASFVNTTGWFVENNVFVADPADPRAIGASLECGDCAEADAATVRNNVFRNVVGVRPPGNFYDVDPGLALSGGKPSPYYAPADAEAFVVDQGAVLPYAPEWAFVGSAPDIGAIEFCPGGDGGGAVAPFGEVGISRGDHNWTRVELGRTYADPIVVLGPPSYSGNQPTTTRVRNVTATGFEWRLDEWEYLDEVHAKEYVSYLVVERGTHLLPDGTLLEASSTSADSKAFVSTPTSGGFEATPIYFAQVTTEREGQAVIARLRNPSACGVEVRLYEEEGGGTEDRSRSHRFEAVHWIAIEPSAASGGDSGNPDFAAVATGPLDIAEPWVEVDASQPFVASATAVIAEIQTTNGSDPMALRYLRSAAADPEVVQLYGQEEESRDEETVHVDESVGLLTFGATGLLYGESAPVVDARTAASPPEAVDLRPYGRITVVNPSRAGRLELRLGDDVAPEEGELEVTLYDLLGRPAYSSTLPATPSLELDLPIQLHGPHVLEVRDVGRGRQLHSSIVTVAQ